MCYWQSDLVRIVAVSLVCAVILGCSPGVVRDQKLQANAPDPIADARSLLRSYSENPVVGSEASEFGDLIAKVTAVDPGKGAALKAFLDGVTKTGKVNRSETKKLLADFE